MKKSDDQPHASRRCGAKTRKGTPCKNWAMTNGRCRMHGGKSIGAPKGNQNAFKHGIRSRSAIEQRKYLMGILRRSRELIKMV